MLCKNSVVIVEDNILVSKYFDVICRQIGLDVVGVVHDADAADEAIAATQPTFVMMDVRLEDERDGVDVALRTHRLMPETKIVFVTGSHDQRTIDRINMDHPYRILTKPVSADDLREAFQ